MQDSCGSRPACLRAAPDDPSPREPVDAFAPSAYSRILRICSFARLPFSDAEDIAQDIWVWLIETGRSAEAASPQWLAAVTINYVKRRRRDQSRRAARESHAAARPAGEPVDLETRLSFDEIERCLPGVEASLLHLVRAGATFAEASRRLRIPRGSSDYYRKLLYRQISTRLAVSAAEASRPPRQSHGPVESETAIQRTRGG